MTRLFTRIVAALLLLAAAGCAGTTGTHESAMDWMQRQAITDDK